MDASAAIYTKPNDLRLTDGQMITMHANTIARLLAANLTLSPVPPGVTHYARRSAVETLFPLVEQADSGSLHMLWGFEASPSTLTLAGLGIFENTIIYLYGDTKAATLQ